MGVALLIGLLVVYAMHRNPEDRAALKRQCTANGEEILQPQWAFVPPVRMQPVVAHTDSEASRDPVKEDRYPETAPVEHEQRRDGANMKKPHGNRSGPVQAFGPGKAEDVRSSLGS